MKYERETIKGESLGVVQSTVTVRPATPIMCACRNCQTSQGACLKAPGTHWVVRLPGGRERGPYATHSEALAASRRAGGGTPVKRNT